jgi:hypothetical protein
MNLYVFKITHEAGDKSIWTMFDEDKRSALMRFLFKNVATDATVYEIGERPISAGADFGRSEPDSRILRHPELLVE